MNETLRLHRDDTALIERLRTRLDPVERPDFVCERSDYDLDGGRPEEEEAKQLAPAAVLAPLIIREGRLQLILTERSNSLAHHPGQIALPGGRLDPCDPGPAAAALREAHEEIGLAPDQVELLGGYEPYRTASGYRVTPFVGLVSPGFAAAPNPNEVASVFEAPFDFLMDPANHTRREVLWQGRMRRFYEMIHDDKRIWGATAGMLKALSDRLRG